MNKKYITIAVTCGFLLISGVCYSCTHQTKDDPSAVLISSLETKQSGGVEKSESFVKGKIELKSETAIISNGENTSAENSNVENSNVENTALIESATKDSASNKKDGTDLSEQNQELAYVHICGAVTNPGVYRIDEGSRIIDVIDLAGGLTEDAAGDYINQAQQITDGLRIYIPDKEEVKMLPSIDLFTEDTVTSKQTSEAKKLVDINEADINQLMELPGIGQKKAETIIEYRDNNGGFQKPEDLMKIPGIKEGMFQKISPYITVK